MKRVMIQVVCLGQNGGPLENHLSSLLVRQAPDNRRRDPNSQYSSNPIVSVDSGALLYAVAENLQKTALHHTPSPPSTPQPSSESTSSPSRRARPSRTPYPLADIVSQTSQLAVLGLQERNCASDQSKTASRERKRRRYEIKKNAMKLARDLMLRHIKSYLVTHPHLDHMAGLVINSPVFAERAGAKRPSVCGTLLVEDIQKDLTELLEGKEPNRPVLRSPSHQSGPPTLVGSAKTVEAMRKHIFNNVIWPNLIEKPATLLETRVLIDNQALMNAGVSDPNSSSTETDPASQLSLLPSPRVEYCPLAPGVSVASFEISHGLPANSPDTDLGGHSTAYFLRFGDHSPDPSRTPLHSRTSPHKEVLILGDVEPDTISSRPRNFSVWQYAAQLIVARRLTALFIECSFSDSRADQLLFGHLTPRHLVAEMVKLSGFVQAEKRRVMAPLRRSAGPRGRDSAGVTDESAASRMARKRLPSPPESSPEIKRGRVSRHGEDEEQQNEQEEDESASSIMDAMPARAEPRGRASDGGGASGRGSSEVDTGDFDASEFQFSPSELEAELDPLSGLTVYIMHIKRDGSEELLHYDDDDVDSGAGGGASQDGGEDSEESEDEGLDDYDPLARLLVKQLYTHARRAKLGCRFGSLKPGWGYHV